MSKAVFYCAFQLKTGASVSDFLRASKQLGDEFISRQRGYISWQQLKDGDTWADFIMFETMEDAKQFQANSEHAGEPAEQFFSFIQLESCKVHLFGVEASYGSV